MKAERDETTGKWTLEGVENDKTTFKNICRMLRERKNFKFARYGDGEINCMMGKIGRNCDSHEYFPDLGQALHRSANNADYMVGIQPLSVERWPGIVEQMFPYTLFNADVLHSASIDGHLGEFMESLAGRHIILVGPTHLANLFDCVHILTPSLNCWLSFEEICQQIDYHLEGFEGAVVLLSCSMMAEVIIDRFKDEYHTFIDTGSVFDPLVGVKSRKYHHKLKL